MTAGTAAGGEIEVATLGKGGGVGAAVGKYVEKLTMARIGYLAKVG